MRFLNIFNKKQRVIAPESQPNPQENEKSLDDGNLIHDHDDEVQTVNIENEDQENKKEDQENNKGSSTKGKKKGKKVTESLNEISKKFKGGVQNFGNDLNKLRKSVQKTTKASLGLMKELKDHNLKEVTEKVKNIKDELKEKITAAVREFLEAQKMRLYEWVFLKIEEAVVNLLGRAKPLLKDALNDPDMPRFIKRALDDLVDDFWPDIEEQILFLYQ